MSILDTLLQMEIPQPQAKKFKLKRLSKLAGEEIILTLQELPYSEVARIRETSGDEMDVHIILKGVTEPIFKDKALMEKYSAATPAELVKKLLSAGEIADISREVEKLSGYRMSTLEEVKKN